MQELRNDWLKMPEARRGGGEEELVELLLEYLINGLTMHYIYPSLEMSFKNFSISASLMRLDVKIVSL